MVSGLGFDGFPPGARKTEQNMLSTAPRVHLNGSGKKNLMDGYGDALHALNKAHKALCQTAPHMRDYYVQPDSDLRFKWAQENHIARLKRLEDTIAEIEALGIAVINQGS